MATTTTPTTEADTRFYTANEICVLALESKGIEVKPEWLKNSVPTTPHFAEIILDADTIEYLDGRGIKQDSVRPDKIITLVDRGPQDETRGARPTEYWNFRSKSDRDRPVEGEYTITLAYGAAFSAKHRGVLVWPNAHGGNGGLVSPGSRRSHGRMFKYLVERQPEQMPEFARLLATTDEGSTVVYFTELGLGGVREMRELFEEFHRGKEVIRSLASHYRQLFRPPPFRDNLQSEALYVLEPDQPGIIEGWTEQLKAYRDSLYV